MSRNKATFLIIAILLGFCSLTARSQEYASVELSEIGKLLKEHPIKQGITKECRDGVITHLGLTLFPQEHEYPYNAVLRFVERFALHAKLLTGTERKLFLSDKNVSLDLSKLTPLDSLSDLSIESDGERYHVRWKDCAVSFPQEYHLIYGLNKKESGKAFRDSILAYAGTLHADDQEKKRIPLTAPHDSASYVVKEGMSYVIHDMNSNKYLVKLNDSTLCPLYNERYAAESVVNLIQQIVSSEDFSLKVKQHLYGYQKASFSVSLNAFSAYCHSLKCTPYVGIEEENDNEVKAVVVYRNEWFKYNHLLYIIVPRQVIRNQKGEITSDLYCYIPTHNLKKRL